MFLPRFRENRAHREVAKLELRLENGRYVQGKYQGFESVDGGQELLQRVLMKLKTRRGSFLPEPEYGSRLYELAAMKPSQRESAAKQYIAEALADETGLSMETLTLSEGTQGELLLEMRFSHNGQGITAQTTI